MRTIVASQLLVVILLASLQPGWSDNSRANSTEVTSTEPNPTETNTSREPHSTEASSLEDASPEAGADHVPSVEQNSAEVRAADVNPSQDRAGGTSNQGIKVIDPAQETPTEGNTDDNTVVEVEDEEEAAGEGRIRSACTLMDIVTSDQCPVSTLSRDINGMIENIATMSGMIGGMMSANRDLQDSVMDQQRQLNRMEQIITEQEENITETSAASCRFESENEQLREVVTTQTGRIAVLEATIEEQQLSILNLTESNDVLSRDMEDLHKRSNSIVNRVECYIGDCQDIYDAGVRSDGVYTTQLRACSRETMSVLCEGMAGGRPWTVIQQRAAADTYFYRPYVHYMKGFGTIGLNTDFWFGLQKIHNLTECGDYMLRVDLKSWEEETAYAEYDHFMVASEEDGFKLSVSGYQGTAGDSLSHHNNMLFSTYDHDQDTQTQNCAETHRAGWWFKSCFRAMLNGEYLDYDEHITDSGEFRHRGIIWRHFKGYDYSLKSASLKVRRRTDV